jgi:hypothetical protein
MNYAGREKHIDTIHIYSKASENEEVKIVSLFLVRLSDGLVFILLSNGFELAIQKVDFRFFPLRKLFSVDVMISLSLLDVIIYFSNHVARGRGSEIIFFPPEI